MTDCKYKMSVGRTFATGIILERELSTDEVYEVIIGYEKEIEQLKKENEAFKDKLQDMGVSDFKYDGVRYYTGLCGDLND